MRPGSGALLAAASAITYGSLGVFVKLAYEEGWNVPSLLTARFLFAALTVLPFALRQDGLLREGPATREGLGGQAASQRGGGWSGFWTAFAIGAIGYTSTTALYFPSIAYLPAAVASFLLYLSPVLVAVLAAIFLHERLGSRGMVALAIALVGLLMLSSGAATGALSAFGVACAVGSAVAFAITVVASRRIAQRMPWARLSLAVALGAFTSYILFSTLTGRLAVPRSAHGIVWAIAIGVLATGIPLSLFFAALARTGASQVSVISTLEPVSTLILAAVFLSEVPTWAGIAGGLLIVVAAAVIASQEPITAPHE